MKILNLGCGHKVSDCLNVDNIDWSWFLRVRRNAFLKIFAPLLFRGERLDRFRRLPANIKVHNLAKGIPYYDCSVDVVYHSHLLEHLDRYVAEEFLREVFRVLVVGGVHRIVVPDLELLCRRYIASLEDDSCDFESSYHDEVISSIFEQSVRRRASGVSAQKGIRRVLEELIFGDARARGETHQWMYDRKNLSAKLLSVGFRKVQIVTFNVSSIPRWNDIGLDLNDDGTQYKRDSLYVEAVK